MKADQVGGINSVTAPPSLHDTPHVMRKKNAFRLLFLISLICFGCGKEEASPLEPKTIQLVNKHLVKPTTIKEIEEYLQIVEKEFMIAPSVGKVFVDGMKQDLAVFKTRIRKGDELYWFEIPYINPPDKNEVGWAIVRNQEVFDILQTIELENHNSRSRTTR